MNITNTGNQKRDFVYVQDVAKANILAMLNDSCNNEVYNIGYGKNYSVNQLALVFNRPIRYGEKRIEPFETLACTKKANEMLNWHPQTDVINWIENSLIGINQCHI